MRQSSHYTVHPPAWLEATPVPLIAAAGPQPTLVTSTAAVFLLRAPPGRSFRCLLRNLFRGLLRLFLCHQSSPNEFRVFRAELYMPFAFCQGRSCERVNANFNPIGLMKSIGVVIKIAAVSA